MKNSFEWNKVFAAVLIAAIMYVGSGVASDIVFDKNHHTQHKDEKKAYTVVATVAPNNADSADVKPVALAPISDLLATADATAGQAVTKKCSACHSFEEGGPNKVGPDLWEIVGRQKASAPGFTYSEALKAMSGEKWDVEKLNAFLHNPKEYAKGTKMSFVGLLKDKERADVIKYLQTLTHSPK